MSSACRRLTPSPGKIVSDRDRVYLITSEMLNFLSDDLRKAASILIQRGRLKVIEGSRIHHPFTEESESDRASSHTEKYPKRRRE